MSTPRTQPSNFRAKLRRLLASRRNDPLIRLAVKVMNSLDNSLENAVNRLLNDIERSGGNKVIGALPKLPVIAVPTPFGSLHTPSFELPKAHKIERNLKNRTAMKAALGVSLVDFVDVLPLVGILSDQIISNYEADIMKVLSRDEFARYIEASRTMPPIAAMIKTLAIPR